MKTNFRFPSGTGCSGRLLHGALHTLAAALLLFAGSACENEDPDVYTPPAPEPLAPLTLVPNMDPRVQNDIEIEEETTGVYRIHTTGEDPYFCTVPFDGNVPADLNVLAFEYQTDRRTDHIQLFFWTEVDGEVIPDVERTIVTTPFEAADTWKEYSVRIRKCREEFFWGEAGNLLRIDFGTVKDADIRLAQPAAARNDRRRTCRRRGRKRERPECIGLRGTAQRVPPRIVHEQSRPRRGDRRQNPHHGQLCGRRELPALRTAALRRHHPHRDRLPEIRHTAHAESVRRHARPHGLARRISLRPAAVAMGRRMPHGRGRPGIVSHGRYADEVAALRNLPPVPMRSKKGLGGFYAGDYTSDLDDLGITSATVNVSPLQFMYLSPAKAGMVEHAYCGETYYFDSEKLDALDATLRETAARDITVAVILLVDPAAEARDAELGALLQHPDYTRGTYTMPNMTTPKAVRAYAAMIDFLAQLATAARTTPTAASRTGSSTTKSTAASTGPTWATTNSSRPTRTPTSNRCACAPRSSANTTPTPNSSPRSPIRGAALRTRAGIPCATWSGCSAISVARKATFAGRSPATVTPRRSPTPVRGANRMRLSR